MDNLWVNACKVVVIFIYIVKPGNIFLKCMAFKEKETNFDLLQLICSNYLILLLKYDMVLILYTIEISLKNQITAL